MFLFFSLSHTHTLREDYQYSLNIDPHCLPAKINLAFLYQAEGKFQQAWNELTSALREEPHCMPALEARAVISLQMGNLFGALLDINAAINVRREGLETLHTHTHYLLCNTQSMLWSMQSMLWSMQSAILCSTAHLHMNFIM